MAGKRVLYTLCLQSGLFLSHCIHFIVDVSVNQLGLVFRPNLALFSYRSANSKVAIIKQQKHGTTVVALPFDYFALSCDVLPNPRPTLLNTGRLIQTYTRDNLLYIGKSLSCAKATQCKFDSRISAAALKIHYIYNRPFWLSHALTCSLGKNLAERRIIYLFAVDLNSFKT